MSLHDNTDDLVDQVTAITRTIGWAEDEVLAAQARHPEAAELIEHSSVLLVPVLPLPWTEPLYRAHCRELLERAAAGEDTEPGTAAECCLLLAEAADRGLIPPEAAGLYDRMWQLAGLPSPVAARPSGRDAPAPDRLDALEQWLRSNLRQIGRALPPM